MTWRIGAHEYLDMTPECAARKHAQALYGERWTAARLGRIAGELGRPGTFVPMLKDWTGKITTMGAPFKVEGQMAPRAKYGDFPAREVVAMRIVR